MKTRSVWCAAALSALALGAVAGCDQKLAVQPARDHLASDETPATTVAGLAPDSARSTAPRRYDAAPPGRVDDAPVRLVKGHPMWADNRRHSAAENAQYQFERHGGELGAKSLDDFVTRVHQVLNESGEGVLSHTRANGDRLVYDPRSKLFGVVRSDGAPRTLFKPDNGRAYYDAEVAKDEDGDAAPRRTTGRTARREGGDQG